LNENWASHHGAPLHISFSRCESVIAAQGNHQRFGKQRYRIDAA